MISMRSAELLNRQSKGSIFSLYRTTRIVCLFALLPSKKAQCFLYALRNAFEDSCGQPQFARSERKKCLTLPHLTKVGEWKARRFHGISYWRTIRCTKLAA